MLWELKDPNWLNQMQEYLDAKSANYHQANSMANDFHNDK
jgi:hypothetical protein